MSPHPFDSVMELSLDAIRLDCAALHLCRDVFPDLNILRYLEQMDALAAEVGECRPGLAAPLRYQAMRDVLVERHGFSGNRDDYYNPRNSYLNCVLDSRSGVPIALSAVWLEVARRLKWPVHGMAFPGHFLIRFDDPDRFLIVDPFEDGRTLAIEDCEAILRHHFDDQVKFSPDLLAPTDVRTILARMLNNLRSIYLGSSAWSRLDSVLERLVALDPRNGQYRGELAALRFRRGDLRGAFSHLANFVQSRPDADDTPTLQRTLSHIEATIAAQN